MVEESCLVYDGQERGQGNSTREKGAGDQIWYLRSCLCDPPRYPGAGFKKSSRWLTSQWNWQLSLSLHQKIVRFLIFYDVFLELHIFWEMNHYINCHTEHYLSKAVVWMCQCLQNIPKTFISLHRIVDSKMAFVDLLLVFKFP